MKKYFFILLSLWAIQKTHACGGGDYYPDRGYYNLFMQELISNPRYNLFLLTESPYYTTNTGANEIKNENIEEWQIYLGLTYDQTAYLVFTSGEYDLRELAAGRTVSDKNLSFVTPAFAKKHKQALLYLIYAKYLEPYMMISQGSSDGWYYENNKVQTADQLDYNAVMRTLTKSWNFEKDLELKLRYGYQMVRFAHYNRRYAEAIQLFDQYVEPLDYKPAMYYHALCQKAGAERGAGLFIDANANFLRVITHSQNLQETAYTSIMFYDEKHSSEERFNYDALVKTAKNTNELNDIYMFLGYLSFSNPLNEVRKIIAQSPDAVQAKVLIARAVNSIERSKLSCNSYEMYYNSDNIKSFANIADKRYPVSQGVNPEMDAFVESTISLVNDMLKRTDVKDKNFWYLTAAYLQFLKKDFNSAKRLLNQTQAINELYANQKNTLAMLIEVCEIPKITPEVEVMLFSKYHSIFENSTKDNSEDFNSTQYFLLDVLANRYFLQKDYAKSFLIHNSISDLERNPNLSLIKMLEEFYQKPGKNEMEQYIAKVSTADESTYALKQLGFIKGIAYLTIGNFDQALQAFTHANNNQEILVSNNIFGYNRIECFNCSEAEVMRTDYLNDFSFIPPSMDAQELTEVLVQLQKQTTQGGELGAKANYLIGNFFYNVSLTGYYRHFLRFDYDNSPNYPKYEFLKNVDIYDNIYFKDYVYQYEDSHTISQKYLEKAYQTARNEELKARIAFALSKCEQEGYYWKFTNEEGYWWGGNDKYIVISNRKYFEELAKYKNTKFYNEVKTNCSYFSYYVNH